MNYECVWLSTCVRPPDLLVDQVIVTDGGKGPEMLSDWGVRREGVSCLRLLLEDE